MIRRLAVLAALFMALFAGCADEGESATRETPTGAPEVELLDAPEWEVGRWWRFESTSGTAYSMVVTEDAGSDRIIDTDDESFAFFDAQGDISTMGPQRKSDLAGSQESDRIRFFEWPLTDQAVWTTPWDGETYEITASAQDDGTFTFVARGDGAMRVSYAYDPEVRWFTDLRFYDANETEYFGSELVESGTGYVGDLLRYEIEILDEGSVQGPQGRGDTFTMPNGTDVHLAISIACTEPGPIQVAVGPIDNAQAIIVGGDSGYSVDGQCPFEVEDQGVIGPAVEGATWGVFIASASGDSVMDWTLLVRTQVLVTL